jgi:two-component system, OmpR family, sensor histidine kinase KdpD
MIALSPARSSVGLSGALVCALLAVTAAALAGGAGPAMLATGVAVVAASFFFAPSPHLIDVLALVVFAAVGGVIGGLVQRLAGLGRQTARSLAEADRLARLAATVLARTGLTATGPRPTGPEDFGEPASDVVAGLRETFDLEAVGILARGEEGWRLLAGAGDAVPDHPDSAQFAAEIGPGRVLVMSGSALVDPDAHPLRAFTAELLLARRRAQLDALAGEAQSGSAVAPVTALSGRVRPEGRKRTPQPGSVMK